MISIIYNCNTNFALSVSRAKHHDVHIGSVHDIDES